MREQSNTSNTSLPSSQCQYKNRRGNLVAPQAARHRESVTQEPRVLFLCFLLCMYKWWSHNKQFGTCRDANMGVHFLGDRSQTGAIFLPLLKAPSLWRKWTRWYKVARCYYQLHVHLKRRALASSLPWNAENSRNPSEAFKEPSIISQE